MFTYAKLNVTTTPYHLIGAIANVEDNNFIKLKGL
jgi:hypothetical protein